MSPTGIVALVAFPFLLLLAVAIVVPGVPVGIHLHVALALLPRLLVVLGLLLPGQAVPLQVIIICEVRFELGTPRLRGSTTEPLSQAGLLSWGPV